jgi:hypothetical protein
MSQEKKIDIPLSVGEWTQILMALDRTGYTDLHLKISETLRLLPPKDVSMQPETAKE